MLVGICALQLQCQSMAMIRRAITVLQYAQVQCSC